jgi:cyclic beta-1,2-glucan synthetase
MLNNVLTVEVEPEVATKNIASNNNWLEELATRLARRSKPIPHPNKHNPLPARAKTLNEFLTSAHQYFEKTSRTETGASHTAEWMLDNFYVIEQTLRQISENIPFDFYRRLPKLNINSEEVARIYALAFILTKTNDSHLELVHVKNFINAFQRTTLLQIGENWAIPPMLRLSVLEILADALARITHLEFLPAAPLTPWADTPDDRRSRPRADDETLVINSILSLRMLATQSWRDFFEETSVVESILRDDPAGVYSSMDFETRNRYRNTIEKLSLGSQLDEVAIAREALSLAQSGTQPRARHIGHYLIGRGVQQLETQINYHPSTKSRLQRWLTRDAIKTYLGSIITITLILCLASGIYAILVGGSFPQVILALILTLLPASAVVVDVVNWLVVQIVPPRVLPRLNFQNGIPPEFNTMVVVPTLLKNEAELDSLLRQLENHYLGNADPNVRFTLLTDFIDAPQKELPGEAELIQKAKDGIERLNLRYSKEQDHPFYLFHRERIWNPKEGCWMGWERKRGKLVEFNSLLSGKERSSFTVQSGDISVLPRIRYVVTLDADTTMPRDCVHQLAGILAHPLNQAEFDPLTGTLSDGYTVIQPRAQVKPSIANRSLFARVYSGDITLDLYTRAISDVYQDLFGEGNYVGKGIYDVAAFEKCLADRVPDNTLLSHDLFEGIHGRCGLATNVMLYEDYPTHYLTYAYRLHRWIRGDWQLLPWLMPRVPHKVNGKIPNKLSALDHWKIIDNLRRSLINPAALAFILAGWFLLPGSAFMWTALALSTFAFSIMTGAITALRAQRTAQYPETTARPVQQAALRALFGLIFLPHESLILIDAIATTLVRLTITRKRLLQWVTAAHTVSVFGRELKIKVARRVMRFAPVFGLLMTLLAILIRPRILWLALPFTIAWIISPYIAVRISQPITHTQKRTTPQQENSLRQLARSTWLYFEKFVGPDDHWLPPDHFQEEPLGLVAHRTSPTNIGLLMLSTLSAWDLGYIGPQELAVRLRNTLDGMDKLEKTRGHLLNWYDTRTLAPLPPRYISTVDNGNLAACLMTLRQGCLDVAQKPGIRWEGLVDTLDLLGATLHQSHLDMDANELRDVIAHLRNQADSLREATECNPQLLKKLFRESRLELEELLAKAIETSAEQLDAETIRRISTWIERARHHLTQIQRDIETLCPWSLNMTRAPALFSQEDLRAELAAVWEKFTSSFVFNPPLQDIPKVCSRALKALEKVISLLNDDEQDAVSWCESFAAQLENAQSVSNALLEDLQVIRDRAEDYIQKMNFTFLYDPQRKVFHIGYNVDSGRLDTSYYDLLASEARLTSLLAIAKGDVPQNHWLHLARPLTQVNGGHALLSWSGTMFEYLMPTLLSRHYPETLLEQSCRAAVQHQIAYTQSKQIPWGISESSFYYFDSNQIYQYRAFGVPGLGYKRGLGEDLVITPYASMLALPFAPQAVLQNLEHLKKINMLGLYGLYEAADFTADRLGTGQECAVVRSYMAHHQGMILLSLCNALCEDSMIRRFHADPRIETVNLLLQEQTPIRAPIEHLHPKEIGFFHPIHATVSLDTWEVKPNTPHPQVHFLSNGTYSLLITATGSGYSRWRDVELTRWRADATLDNYGSWIYIKDHETDQVWSAGFQPTNVQPNSQQIKFHPHMVEFLRSDNKLSTRTEIVVAPNMDAEIRLVTLTNHSATARSLELTSFAEVILSPQAADQRHPAYNKLFIESEFIADGNILLFRRRPRSAKEKPIHLAHFVIGDPDYSEFAGYETDRDRFIGRGNTQHAPAALKAKVTLSNSNTTLDPIFAVQTHVIVPEYESVSVAFVTLAAASHKEALQLAQRFNQWRRIRKSFDEARAQTEQELNQIGLSSKQLEQAQKLLSALLYPGATMRTDPSIIASNTLGQSGLWPFAISGDYPILLARVKKDEELELLGELVRAHTYWRRRGLMIDLVILNQRENSYDQSFQAKIYRLLLRTNSDDWLGKRGGIFILNEYQIPKAERTLIETAARVILDGGAGTLAGQLQKLDRIPVPQPRVVPIRPLLDETVPILQSEQPSNLLFDNGLGGFDSDRREYVIHLDRGQWTPTPWVNVIANPDFGFVVSEAGLGCTWAINSGENRLTPWHNDPVSDPPSEAVYLRDEDTGQVWSPTPLPARANAPYLIRHGLGYTIFEHGSHQLEQRLKVFAATHAPIKIVQLKLKNTIARTRRINITYYAEWVLGSTRENMAQYIVPEFAPNCFALLAHNPYNFDFGKRVAFLAATRELQGLTTDRAEFLGSLGSYAHPDALDRVGLTANAQAGSDPCAAIQLLLWLAPNETKEVTFLLGQGADRADALRLIAEYQNLTNIEAAWESLRPFWDEHIGKIQVQTPDKAMDLLINQWLPYQALTCRIWGRTAFYQSGGAFGYRDQLQDVLAFAYTKPEITRQHILNAASHQFEEGDVLHWWHPPADKGVRTRISDNLIWLPYVTAQYVQITGDHSILDEKIPFLSAEPLKNEEHDRYGKFSDGKAATLYEHCRRALAKGMTSGKHGLPLMGEGDWNDGMNQVGTGGVGESVWLGWFLYSALTSFAEVCEADQAVEYRKQAEALRTALEASAWDGNWYRRAYYDDGKPLGSLENHECQIDSISQSWSVISGAADPERAATAMESLYQRLIRRDDGLILLLTPPFDRTAHDPGYIKGYLPGIRENGGQYTHAAMWAIWAFAELGQAERAAELFKLVNPIYHADTPEKVSRYKVEPYVIAADVYSAPRHIGRGGWTWYTGSASWMLRLGVEKILGLQRKGNHLTIKPCIPKDWREYTIHYRFGSTIYHIHVGNLQYTNDSRIRLTLNGNSPNNDALSLELEDDGYEHNIHVVLE